VANLFYFSTRQSRNESQSYSNPNPMFLPLTESEKLIFVATSILSQSSPLKKRKRKSLQDLGRLPNNSARITLVSTAKQQIYTMDPNSETAASASGPAPISGKRTRFSNSTTAGVVGKPKSALESAKFATSVVTATLQPAIKSLSEHCSGKFLQLKTALVNLDATKSRFQSDDFIPTSARFKFTLKASDSVKENLSQDFDTLAERANTTLLVFQRDMKDYIEKTVDLEIKVTHNALVNTFCAAVGGLGIAFAMNTPNLNPRIS
jgi:hypothetical protein